jgi:hypothetical protein
MVSLADAAFRLRRNSYPGYDGEGGRRVGGWWHSKAVPVLYMSENRWLAVLEVLVHLSETLPDKYLLGAADIPEDVAIERIARLARGTVDIKSSRTGCHQASWRRLDCPAGVGSFVRPFRNPWRTELRSESRALGVCKHRVYPT